MELREVQIRSALRENAETILLSHPHHRFAKCPTKATAAEPAVPFRGKERLPFPAHEKRKSAFRGTQGPTADTRTNKSRGPSHRLAQKRASPVCAALRKRFLSALQIATCCSKRA